MIYRIFVEKKDNLQAKKVKEDIYAVLSLAVLDTNILTVVHILPINFFYCGVCLISRFVDILPLCNRAENPTAVCDELAVFNCRSRMY